VTSSSTQPFDTQGAISYKYCIVPSLYLQPFSRNMRPQQMLQTHAHVHEHRNERTNKQTNKQTRRIAIPPGGGSQEERTHQISPLATVHDMFALRSPFWK